nr:LysM peptidoglycan-binding domain-containing protein [Yersinia sp. 22-579]
MTAPTLAPVKSTSVTKTVAYRLKRGESAYTVATRYGLSFSALAQLNQNRTFAKGFHTVGEGDEIFIPTQALTDAENTAQTLAGPGVSRPSSQLGTVLK